MKEVFCELSGDGMNIKIEKFNSRHLDKGFFETLSNLSYTGVRWRARDLDLVRDILENPHQEIFVAVNENTDVVGTITLLLERKLIHDGGMVGHIEDVATRKGWEGKGIGRMLVERAVLAARESGCYKVILDCSEENVPFYEKSGFHRHEVAMRMDLIRKTAS